MRMEWCVTCQAVAEYIQEANRKCEFSIVAIVDCYNIAEGKTGPIHFCSLVLNSRFVDFLQCFLVHNRKLIMNDRV